MHMAESDARPNMWILYDKNWTLWNAGNLKFIRLLLFGNLAIRLFAQWK